MKTHRIILGWLFLIFGTLFFLVFGLTFVSNISSFDIFHALVTIIFSIGFFLMSFSGFGLLRNASWAYFPAQIAAYINIINIPIGTVLAIYFIWYHRSYIKNQT